MKRMITAIKQWWNSQSANVLDLPAPPEPLPYELERAMKFCYALLGPGQNANNIIAQNPDRAEKAHRAFYEYRNPGKSYDEMMTRMSGYTE